MEPSIFAPNGLLLLSGEKPTAELLHETIVRLLSTGEPGDLSTEVGSLIDCFAFALARVMARVQVRQRQIDGERLAYSAYELLGALESEYGLKPGLDDTLAQRQAALLAAGKAALGSRRPALEQALMDLLGDDFIGIHIPDPATEVDIWPADLGDDPQLLAEDGIPRKLVSLPLGVSFDLGSSQYIPYVPVSPTTTDGSHTLLVGDQIAVGVDNLGMAETVTITATATSGGTLLFEGVFNNAHDMDAVAVTMPFPAWGSWQRHIFVVLAEAAALDAEKRRKTHVLMAKAVTGVTTWSICLERAPGQAGPFTMDDAVLGALDFNPMGIVTIP